ncbi:MAG TPA: T9SS type A sorting domain-containing protein, partial [Bacteroidetes bacterium]|nr:T9SS type A sorting domain-containing protein [Bacteroidota bacterium]
VRIASPTRNSTYRVGAGTSFSAPAISGLCALLLQANPRLTPMRLRDILRESSHNHAHPDTLLGWGIPDGLAAFYLGSTHRRKLVIRLARGWNMISSNVQFDSSLGIPEAFSKVVERDNLFLAADGYGNFYSPAYNFNNIPDWNPYQGYQVRVYRLDSLTFDGLAIDYEHPVSLDQGWHIVAYLPDFPLPAEQAFASLVREGSLIMARDEDGWFYLPARDFNNMPDLVPGRGYQLRLSRECVLTYPRVRAGGISRRTQPKPVIFPLPEPDIDGMSVLLIAKDPVRDGDEIGFITADNRLIGSGVFRDGKCGVTIWGDSLGEFPVAHVYRTQKKELVKPEFQWITGSTRFIPGEFAVLSVEVTEKNCPDAESSLYFSVIPNPFNQSFSVRYATVGRRESAITIYDLLGRVVAAQTFESAPQGLAGFNSDAWPGGSYIIQVRSGDISRQQIIRLVK